MPTTTKFKIDPPSVTVMSWLLCTSTARTLSLSMINAEKKNELKVENTSFTEFLFIPFLLWPVSFVAFYLTLRLFSLSVHQSVDTVASHTLFVHSTHNICGKRPVCTQVDTIHTHCSEEHDTENTVLLTISALLCSVVSFIFNFETRTILSEVWRSLHLSSWSLTVEILIS